MLVRRVLGTATVVLLTLGVGGCGGGDDEPSAGPTSGQPTSAPATGHAPDEPMPGVPTETRLQQPRAKATIAPSGTATALPDVRMLTAPRGAPVKTWPVPTDVKITDPGAVDDTWQFDLHTREPAKVIRFYEQVLPRLGYRVRTDLTYTLGDEPVHWDLVFDGKVSGSMVRDPAHGVVFVVVNPPGQPAIAGETPSS
ncbi:MAG: hypothetical protein J7518_18825 [Nocardioidaceae bacterium]|nr:hypothetical protein [Nocardioidaceae bacterium]